MSYLLTILILIPLIGAVVTAFLPNGIARPLGLAVSGVTLAVAVFAGIRFDIGGGMQFEQTEQWIQPLGVHFALGLDGLGLLMVLLTALLVPIVLLASWGDADHDPRSFVAWTLALEAMSLAVFMATDVFLFYIVFEATLIPAYFLIAGFGREGGARAAMKFLIYQLAGGLIMLASVIGLYVVSADAGRPTYLITDLMALDIDPVTQRWLFLGFFIAFAIKAPMFPVHTWLADATEKATPGTSVLLVCILDKIGTFGMLRFCLQLLPDASVWATPVVVALALVSIIYGAFVAIGQDDLLRLVGLTSLSHFGFIVLGIFVFNSQGGTGAVLYMVNHGLSTALLFLMAGYIIRRTGTSLISEMRGVERLAPVLAGFTLLAGLAACGLPGLAPFVSEFLVIVGAFGHAWWAGAIAATAIILAAVYVLWMYQRIMTGPGEDRPAEERVTLPDLTSREIGIVAPLVVALLVFGFYPAPLLDIINPYVDDVLTQVGTTPAPVPVPAELAEGGHE